VDDGLLDVVLQRLDGAELGVGVEAAVIAALEGEEELSSVLSSEATVPTQRRPAGDSASAPAGPGAYLRSLTVAGFRGIGPAATLTLEPGPGLTVVAGRNGSGKSSFAEAFEVLMTGTLRRWDSRSQDWKETWRCLHAPTTEITADLTVEGVAGPTVLHRVWAPHAKRLDEARTTVSPHGGPVTDVAGMGWSAALEDQRPFLSHAELEALLAQPKALHDQLNQLLGLDDLDTATQRLAAQRIRLDKEAKTAKAALVALRTECGTSTDPRAAQAAGLLAARDVDADAVEALALGATGPADGVLSTLDQLANLALPSEEEVLRAATQLQEAAEGFDRAATTAADAAAATSALLRSALAVLGPSDLDCPVCETPGAVGAGWRDRATTRAATLEAQSGALEAARRELDTTRGAALDLVRRAPAALDEAGAVGVDSGDAIEAWAAWAAVPEGTGAVGAQALTDHLLRTHRAVEVAVVALGRNAERRRSELADEWAPLAARLVAWCATARTSDAAKSALAHAKAAEAWLKAAVADLRDDRLRPLADQTVELWNELRQASNVDLRELRLTGSGNRARVDFQVVVDGMDATGLGVMSQGEANALALSVFLPRAMLPGSPFGFLVIDDPIQAMDPSKVDGLARVLVRVAEGHQVVVFTHDDRLPEAMRRLGLPGRVLSVTRRDRSVITVDEVSDPFGRLLRDARLIIGSEGGPQGVPAPVAAQVVPGICRTAIEAVCNDLVRGRLLGRGRPSAEVEEALSDADRLWSRLSLAIHGEVVDDNAVRSWLEQKGLGWASPLVAALNRGAHGDVVGTAADTVRDTERLGRRLRELL